MDKLKKMTKLLSDRDKTCILLKNGEIVFEDTGLGVKPLRKLRAINIVKMPGDHLVIVDRVIGKGALMLCELMGVDEIYTPLTSKAALKYSEKCGIPVHGETIVPFIENRDRTGMCPIENSVLHTEDPEVGEANIESAISILMGDAKTSKPTV